MRQTKNSYLLLIIAFIIFHLFLVVSVSAQSETGKANRNTKTEQELLKANQEYDTALLRGDAVALDRLYADEFVYTNPDGEIRYKAQQLAFTRSGDLKFESAQSSDVKVRVYGKTAVMTGRFNAKGTFKGKTIDVRERYTAVWVKQNGRWQLVAEQGNFIKQQ
jgi:ketosteroid isomerase-like protein